MGAVLKRYDGKWQVCSCCEMQSLFWHEWALTNTHNTHLCSQDLVGVVPPSHYPSAPALTVGGKAPASAPPPQPGAELTCRVLDVSQVPDFLTTHSLLSFPSVLFF